MKNYKILKEKGVSQHFVKIYEQNSEEAKIIYDNFQYCIVMEAGEISLDQLFKS